MSIGLEYTKPNKRKQDGETYASNMLMQNIDTMLRNRKTIEMRTARQELSDTVKKTLSLLRKIIFLTNNINENENIRFFDTISKSSYSDQLGYTHDGDNEMYHLNPDIPTQAFWDDMEIVSQKAKDMEKVLQTLQTDYHRINRAGTKEQA